MKPASWLYVYEEYKLMFSLYNPSPGHTALGELDPIWFRNKIAMVQQEPSLFACSIKENISYGKDECSDDEVRLHTFVSGFAEIP